MEVGGIVRLTSFAIKITIAVELIGAILMLPVFWSCSAMASENVFVDSVLSSTDAL